MGSVTLRVSQSSHVPPGWKGRLQTGLAGELECDGLERGKVTLMLRVGERNSQTGDQMRNTARPEGNHSPAKAGSQPA